jgi:flagellar motor protein MotB
VTVLRRSRWAISFADLCLLLLGFFVLLNASRQGPGNVVSHVSEYFGGRARQAHIDIPAAELFEPGEAMLSASGRARLLRIGMQDTENKELINISSAGQDRAGRRFDRWDLAAARLAATARALQEAGVKEGRIRLRGLDENAAATGGQHIIIWKEKARNNGG